MIAGAGAVLGALFGGKRSARSIANAVGSVASKAGQTATTSQRKQTAEAKVEQTTDDLAELEQEIIDEVTAIDDKWKAHGGERGDRRDPARGDRRPRHRRPPRLGAGRLSRVRFRP